MSKPGHGSLVCLSTTHGGKISFIKKINPPIRHLRGKVDMMLSLTSGTFVLLVRPFFVFSGIGAACRASKGDRQR